MRIAAWIVTTLLAGFLGWLSFARYHADTDLAISLVAFVGGTVGAPLVLATAALWGICLWRRTREGR